MGKYSVLIKQSAAKELGSVGRRSDRQRIVQRIQSLSENPRPHGCEKLSGRSDRYRIRQGPYRIVYSIDDDVLTVTVVKIGHRSDVYR